MNEDKKFEKFNYILDKRAIEQECLNGKKVKISKFAWFWRLIGCNHPTKFLEGCVPYGYICKRCGKIIRVRP